MRTIAALLLIAVLLPGCARRTEPLNATAGVAPALTVERFLRAVNVNDWETMGRLFGNREGSVLQRHPRSEVEHRMFLLANVLRHEDHALVAERPVPGRSGEAVHLLVNIKVSGREHSVPFVVVRSRRGDWLVEEIDIEVLTRGR